ncbi:MAG: membrane protein insertion efficiency factor YidD [Clostridia bacterium]
MNKILKIIFYPFKILEICLIYLYKLIISPCLPKTCRFTPSCSTYAVLAVKEFGIFKGTIFALKRIVRCNPKNKGGFDPIPLNIKGELKWLL